RRAFPWKVLVAGGLDAEIVPVQRPGERQPERHEVRMETERIVAMAGVVDRDARELITLLVGEHPPGEGACSGPAIRHELPSLPARLPGDGPPRHQCRLVSPGDFASGFRAGLASRRPD